VISPPFAHALSSAFVFGLVAMLIAAATSLVPAKGDPWFGCRRRARSRPPAPGARADAHTTAGPEIAGAPGGARTRIGGNPPGSRAVDL
jgi:hypothetical protein